MSASYVELCEELSFYNACFRVSDPLYAKNPTAHSHYRVTVGDQDLSVLSRIACYAPDYSGRSNYLAHHLVVDPQDERMSAGGPAALMTAAAGLFCREWNDAPHAIPQPAQIPDIKGEIAPAVAWQDLAGDAGWAGALAQHVLDGNGAPACIVFEPRNLPDPDAMVRLIAEALAFLPEARRWDVTFNTYLQRASLKSTCLWRCCAAKDAEPIEAVRRTPGALVLDLTMGPLGTATGELAECARFGRTPDWGKILGPTASQATAPQAVRRRGETVPATDLRQARMAAPAPPRGLSAEHLAEMASQIARHQARFPRWAVAAVLGLAMLLAGGLVVLWVRSRPVTTAKSPAPTGVRIPTPAPPPKAELPPEKKPPQKEPQKPPVAPPKPPEPPEAPPPPLPVQIVPVLPDKLTRDILMTPLMAALRDAGVSPPVGLSFLDLRITIATGNAERIELMDGKKTSELDGATVKLKEGKRFTCGSYSVTVFPESFRTPERTHCVIFEFPGQWRAIRWCPQPQIPMPVLVTNELSLSNPEVICRLGSVWTELSLQPEEKEAMDSLLWDQKSVVWAAELAFAHGGLWITLPRTLPKSWRIEKYDVRNAETVFKVGGEIAESDESGLKAEGQTLVSTLDSLKQEIRNQYDGKAFNGEVRKRLEAALGLGSKLLAELVESENRVAYLQDWSKAALHKFAKPPTAEKYKGTRKAVTDALAPIPFPPGLTRWDEFDEPLLAMCKVVTIPQLDSLAGGVWMELMKAEYVRRSSLRRAQAYKNRRRDEIEKLREPEDAKMQMMTNLMTECRELRTAADKGFENAFEAGITELAGQGQAGTVISVDKRVADDIRAAVYRYGELHSLGENNKMAALDRDLDAFAACFFEHQSYALRPVMKAEEDLRVKERHQKLKEALEEAIKKGWIRVTVRKVTCSRSGGGKEPLLHLTPAPAPAAAEGVKREGPSTPVPSAGTPTR
jgi:hypothetical protein